MGFFAFDKAPHEFLCRTSLQQVWLAYHKDGRCEAVKQELAWDDYWRRGFVALASVTDMDELMYIGHSHVPHHLQNKGWGKEAHGARLLKLMEWGARGFACLTYFEVGRPVYEPAQESILKFYGWSPSRQFTNPIGSGHVLWTLTDPDLENVKLDYEQAKGHRIAKGK